MIELSAIEVKTYYAVRVPNMKQAGSEWRGPCPVHHGKRDSFAVQPDTGRWFCHSTCGRGGDIIELETAITGAEFKTAKVEVYRVIGRADAPNGSHPAGARIAATYDYTDEAGQLLYQAVRMDPKDFRQRKPDGNNGWVWNIKGVRLVPYRLPELLKRATETVFICEGEKDVHSLESLRLLATCNPMGAGKWRAEYSEALRGRSAVILPDNDKPGRAHSAAIATDLLRVGCEVRLVELPRGKDASDWLGAGGTLEELQGLVGGQPALTNETLATWRAQSEPDTGSPSFHPDKSDMSVQAQFCWVPRGSDFDKRPTDKLGTIEARGAPCPGCPIAWNPTRNTPSR